MSSPIDELHEWNRKMVEDFRANGGKPGGPFAGSPLLLLHTIGARSGRERINPLMYQDLGDGRPEPGHQHANPDLMDELNLTDPNPRRRPARAIRSHNTFSR